MLLYSLSPWSQLSSPITGGIGSKLGQSPLISNGMSPLLSLVWEEREGILVTMVVSEVREKESDTLRSREKRVVKGILVAFSPRYQVLGGTGMSLFSLRSGLLLHLCIPWADQSPFPLRWSGFFRGTEPIRYIDIDIDIDIDIYEREGFIIGTGSHSCSWEVPGTRRAGGVIQSKSEGLRTEEVGWLMVWVPMFLNAWEPGVLMC